jgi:hypothetical protein
MSSYCEHGSAPCRWCAGIGYSYYGSYTSGAEETFRCFSCGQDYFAEGHYLEHVTVTGGYGVLICLYKDLELPRLKNVRLYVSSVGKYAVYRLGSSPKINHAAARRLKSVSTWALMVEYDRDSAPRAADCRYDLTAVERKVTVVHGRPPSHDAIVSALFEVREPKTDIDMPLTPIPPKDGIKILNIHDIGESEEITF